MTAIYTLSAYETTARAFFEKLRLEQAGLLLDVRLKNTNQLCGFTKGKDLEYLVPALTGAVYVHDLRFAPDPGLLERYLKQRCSWEEYKLLYQQQMQAQNITALFQADYGAYASVCLLGTATRKRRSHSEALAQLLAGK